MIPKAKRTLKAMRFQSIHLTNYRCHANLKIDFKPGFNVIVGVNGSGKTSVLKAVCEALTGFTNQFSVRAGNSQEFSEAGVVRMKVEIAHDRYRFEEQYPVQIGTSAVAFGLEIDWTFSKLREEAHLVRQGMSPEDIWLDHRQIGQQLGKDLSPKTLPVIAFYRANRRWNQPQPTEMQAATARSGRTDGYVHWWDASLDSGGLQAWVIGKCLERFQTSSETGKLFDDIDSDELALVNHALGEAVEGIKGLRYDLKQRSLLVEWAAVGDIQPQPTAFENLSDGQQAVIGLVADIARRMCLLNPHLDQDVTRKTPGMVLIDELDVHLHPKWQRILTRGLKRAFPEVQFIVASHSPQVLGELHPDEIILLRPGGTSHPQVSYGLTSSQVLEEIMDADARAPEVQNLLTAAFEVLERGELQNARTRLTELEDVAPGIPELAGAWALLRRKEVLGR